MAAVPSVLGATLTKAIIPLVPLIKEEDLEKVTLTSYVTVGQAPNQRSEKRKATIISCSTGDPETLLRTIVEFLDAASQVSRLNLTAGPNRYNKFRECLGGAVRDTWDVIAPNHAQTVNGFEGALSDFVAQYLMPTAGADQRLYLDTIKKPFRLTVQQLAERLRFINRLMRWFPGNAASPFDESTLKLLFYNMMLPKWKLAFLSSGTDINDGNYTLLHLQRYMTIQETAFNAEREMRHRQKLAGRGGGSSSPQRRQGYGTGYGTSPSPQRRRMDHVGRYVPRSPPGRGGGRQGARGSPRGGYGGRSRGQGGRGGRGYGRGYARGRNEQYLATSSTPTPGVPPAASAAAAQQPQDSHYHEEAQEDAEYYEDGYDEAYYNEDEEEPSLALTRSRSTQDDEYYDDYAEDYDQDDAHWMDNLQF